MFKKVLTIGFAVTLLAFAVQPAAADPYPWPGEGFAGGFISLDSFGASNATSIPILGDVLSGDLNSNLQYRGISDRGWLGYNLDTPGEACRGTNQFTGSLWWEVIPLSPMEPPTGALSAGYSVIQKDDGDIHLMMEIWAIVWDTQTTMGYRPTGRGSILSRSGVLELTYKLTNIGTGPVLDLKFYQYLHPHPNGSCYDLSDGTPSHEASAIKGAYDPKLYMIEDPNFPISQKFHFDLTFWAPDIDDLGWIYPGSTLGIAALEQPSVWGMGPVGNAPPTPDCSENPDLIWCQAESNNLPNPRATWMGPGHIAGVLGWELPRLNTGHSVERHVLFAVADDRPLDP